MDGRKNTRALAAASLITNAVSIFLFVIVSQGFGSGWKVPVKVAHPSTLVLLLLLGLGGFLLWNTIFAAVAATVNDLNTSARSALILLPGFPLAFAFFALNNPDSILMRVLSVIPITSPAVMSARLVLTEVAVREVPLALMLLGSAAWFFRTASGRIFRLGMLMYGKEPTFKETLRWARH